MLILRISIVITRFKIYVNDYMCGVWWKLRSNTLGQWAVTELLDLVTAKQVKEKLGSWFCEFRTNNK